MAKGHIGKGGEASRRRIARKRRQKAQERQNQNPRAMLLAAQVPAAHVRVFSEPLKIADGNVVKAFLIENRQGKDTTGRYAMGGLTKHLKTAVSVRTLIAFHELLILRGSAAQAKEELRRAEGPGDIDYRLGLGREHLATMTGFDSEAELKAWAERSLEAFRLPNGFENEALGAQVIASVTEPVRLCFRAYQRAQIVETGLSDASKSSDALAHTRLEAAFMHAATQVSAAQAVGVAQYADIDPAQLWLEYSAAYQDIFELARFVGRLQSGADAILAAEHLDLAWRFLETHKTDTLQHLWALLKQIVDRYLTSERLSLAVALAAACEGHVHITRSRRDVVVVMQDGLRYLVSEHPPPVWL